nr:zinc-binding dehydrogenase [Gordonia paraffinivorans]
MSGGSGTDGRFRVGQRVAFFPGTPSCAEYVLVDAEHATLVPDDMDDEVAAQLHVNPLTATMLLRAAEDSGAASGTRTPTVITAGGSTVSRMFAALASKKNVPVVSLVRRDSAVEALQQQLPECAVVSTEGASWKDELAAAVGENGIRVALDTVGGETGTDLLRMLAPGGALIVFGDLSGGLLQASALDFPIRGIQIFGVTLIDWPRLPTDVRASDVAGAVQLAQERPDLFSAAATYDLGDVREAALHAERPEKSGLVILRSDPTGSLHTNHRT